MEKMMGSDPMPDLRTRIEAELERHNVFRWVGTGGTGVEWDCAWKSLIAALVRVVEEHISRCPHHPDGSGMIACEYCEQGWRPRPTPSREALETDLRREFAWPTTDLNKILGIVMAWATGNTPKEETVQQLVQHIDALCQQIINRPSPVNPESTGKPKRWCEHIVWDEKRWTTPGWYLLYPEKWSGGGGGAACVPNDHWDMCPVKGCHARRPE